MDQTTSYNPRPAICFPKFSMTSAVTQTLPLDVALQLAITHHQAGRLQDAEQLYRTILQVQPDQSDANHNLGVLAGQVGQYEAGLPYLKAALTSNPYHEQYSLSYANALLVAGQAKEALSILQTAMQRGLNTPAAQSLRQIAEAAALNAPAKDEAPTPAEINQLIALFNAGLHVELEGLTRALVGKFPDSGLTWKILGASLRMQGKNALSALQMATELLPDDAETHYNLGVALNDCGQLDAAVISYGHALEIGPDYAAAHYNLGVVLQRLGQLDDAVVSYNRGLSINPDFAEAHNNLGNALKGLGQLDGAVASYSRAAEIKPDFTEAHYNLAAALNNLGQLESAVVSYSRAVEIKPDFTEAHYNLGAALNGLGQFESAVASYRRALKIDPEFADAHNNLGTALQSLGQLENAMRSYSRAIEIKPDFTEAHYNLGTALNDLGQLENAVVSYRRALAIDPEFADAHNNLGTALQSLGQLEIAVASYNRAVEIKPDYAEAYSNLGNALKELGKLNAAMASCCRARELRPHSLQYALHAHLLLPIFPETLDAVAVWRERYQAGIAALMDASGILENPGENVNTFSFYLAYQNYNDRPVMESLCRFFRKRLPTLTTNSPHLLDWRPPIIRGQRIRVGFLSEFLVGHTIGKLYQGFIRHLNRSRFEVIIIHTPKAKRDSFNKRLDALADRVLTLPTRLEDQQQAIMAEKLDVLFYPDIGMASSTYFLAYGRFAAVQAVGWGHPDTTGLDTMDYFVSAASIEPENADEHYTERLIRLSRMPCFYQPLTDLPTQIPDRATLGLPETGTLYGCPQSLFKFHPDFDGVLAAIAEGDPAGRIVLLEGKHSAWAAQLKARWAKTAPILLERVLFLPQMPLDRFMALIAHIDVLLDPIHFGSGNTLYEAMAYGTPVVTWPGQFMRGRIVAGAYRQMGVAEAPVALRLEDYASVALALGRNPERRLALRQALQEAANRELFADTQAVREFEIFLDAAVTAAGTEEKLPEGWKPDVQISHPQQGIFS